MAIYMFIITSKLYIFCTKTLKETKKKLKSTTILFIDVSIF